MFDAIILVAEKFGLIAIACGCAFWMVNRQQTWIQEEALKEVRESFSRLEKITVALITAQKKHSLDLKGLQKSYESMAYIIKKLSGNGLKDKFK